MKPNPIQPGDSSHNRALDVKLKVRSPGGNKESSLSSTIKISKGLITGHWHEPIWFRTQLGWIRCTPSADQSGYEPSKVDLLLAANS